MKIVQHVFNSFLQVANLILEELEKGIDYPRFQLQLQDELNKMGRNICKEILEGADEYVREHRDERVGWSVERCHDEKTVLSPFGEVTYRRTYFCHKGTGEYRYLADHMAGYSPHTRVDMAVKANLADFASEISYRKSGQEPGRNAKGTEVSGQTVLNAIRDLDTEVKEEENKERRQVRVLYIEADEDHVACQDGSTVGVPLVYVHEGRFNKGSRSYLKNVHYFSGLYSDTEELWYQVLNYLDGTYDLDKAERIFIAGDGAKWIRLGTKIIPKSIFVLDRYHLAKYVLAAVGRGNDISREIWRAIDDAGLDKVKAVFKEAHRRAETEGRRNAIKQCRRYVMGNWDGIQVYKTYSKDVIGCSAEGHVGHVLSARLSSRPMGWGKQGMDKMARMRAMKANGINIREQYLQQQARPVTVLKVCQVQIQNQRKLLQQPPYEMLGNIPALKGRTTALTQTLRAIKSA